MRTGVLLAVLLSAPALAQTLYLSPASDDHNDGLSRETPLATPARAVERMRELKSADGGGRTIVFADGVYALDRTLVLDAQDSGLTFRATPGRVLLSGGAPVRDGWTSRPFTGGTLYSARLDPLEDGRLVRDVYYRNTRCLRARFPNPANGQYKYTTLSSVLGPGQDRFQLAKPPPGLGPDAPLGMEIVAVRAWAMPRQRVNTRASHGTTLVCEGPLGATTGTELLVKGTPVYLENWPAFIDTPLEWTLTRQTPSGPGDLRLLLPAGSEPGSDVIAPHLEHLLILAGCSDVSFEGVDFAFTDQPFPIEGPGRPGSQRAAQPAREGYDPLQSGQDRLRGDSSLSGAIELRAAADCTLKRCRIAHTGGNAVMIDGPRNRILECEIFDTGGAAVSIGPYATATRDPSPGCAVADCAIHNFGAVYGDFPAIWAARAPNLVIEHNHISQGGYSGVSVGWIWGHAYDSPPGECPEYHVPRIMESTIVRNNDISAVMRELTDGGAIYSLGSQDGPDGPAVMTGNWVHDIHRNPVWTEGFCMGLYFDQGAAGWLITSNLVERVDRLVHFSVFNNNGRTPNPCSGCSERCPGNNPYGHAVWHSPFRSDNGHLWPGQQWDPRFPNLFDRDPRRIPDAGWGTEDLPACVILPRQGPTPGADTIRAEAGPRLHWVFERDMLVHPYRNPVSPESPRRH